ncbi:MAG TPA: hypothetical protein DDZ92_13240, partial [Halomonas sp.]|nr:hypothetical protein [Halomonas sp.]
FGDLAARYLVAYLVANEVRRWGGLVGHGGVDNLMVDGVLGTRYEGNRGLRFAVPSKTAIIT